MKTLLSIFCLGMVLAINCLLVTGCQSTAAGFSRDTDRNIDAMRKAINDN